MADTTHPDAAAKAKAEQDAKARTAAILQASPKEDDTVATLAATVRNLERRTRLPDPAAATEGIDTTVPGGKYKVGGRLVNAHNREIDEEGNLLHPEEQQIDAFGRKV